MKNQKNCETIVIGHRNPDTDSIAASYAMAELKTALGMPNVKAACAGLPGARTEYLFERFGVALPQVLSDVYPRVGNIANPDFPRLTCGDSLYHALELLGTHHVPRLPVIDKNNTYCGMLCLYSLLGDLLNINQQERSTALTGRVVHSSIELICQVIEAEALYIRDSAEAQDFEVYVAAMNIDSFKEHIPRQKPQSLAIVVGDRVDVHLMAVNSNARLVIVTGSRKVDPVILQAAEGRGVSMIKTSLDSATVIRRLKFSCPVDVAMTRVNPYMAEDRLSDIRGEIMREHDDVFPVTDSDGFFAGAFRKQDMEIAASRNLILVDHNEFDQAVAGVEELPVVEVVDHHRFGMPPTHTPIKINCDIVGSSCTLLTEMYRASGVVPSPATAGVMMGGIVTDTLMLRSPTATGRDRTALEYLQSISGVDPEQLLEDIFKVGSLISRSTPEHVVGADCKVFHHRDKISFALAQVEEVGFDEFYAQRLKLQEAAENMRKEKGLDFFGLLVTNVVEENSILLAVGNQTLLKKMPYRKIRSNLWDLPGILSRKKQLLPQMLKLLDELTGI